MAMPIFQAQSAGTTCQHAGTTCIISTCIHNTHNIHNMHLQDWRIISTCIHNIHYAQHELQTCLNPLDQAQDYVSHVTLMLCRFLQQQFENE